MYSIDPSYRGIPTFTSASLLKLKKDTLCFIQNAFMRRILKSSKGTPTQHYMKIFWVELACKHNIKTSNKKIAGKLAGKEDVELYVSAPAGNLEKPARELKAFAKTKELKSGESQILAMKFTNYDLASYDESYQAWITDGGRYTAKFGSSVNDIFASVVFSAKTSTVKAHDVLNPTEKINKRSPQVIHIMVEINGFLI